MAAHCPVKSISVNSMVGELDGVIVRIKCAREYDETLTPIVPVAADQ